MLRGEERRPLEKRNHVLEKVASSSDDIDQCTILPSVGLDVAASSEPLAYQSKHLSPVTVLADMELGNQLIAAATRGVAVDGDCKAALAIYVARNVAIQPFLLIVRTRHIFTLQDDPVGTLLHE